jgi:ABC-type polysaccharide/polyol phosphate transport system ATPase subunit
MATTPLIRFDGVWKKFRKGEVHDSLRDLIPALVRGFASRSVDAELRGSEFWALRDVSFKVEPGEALGIIGSNGAGKSTALKVLTRILMPTLGNYIVRGRVGSLIEVAAGFHQDLTGRENIFLQGAIMGMRRSQVRHKLDAIIAFSGIEEFIDTPVKRYSSGMNARLGFAIAAHLDPEVLIIDEALAVGDHTFQRQAFSRIRELAASGMPVVMVTHQLDRMAELCTKALLLNRGEVVAQGTPTQVIHTYLNAASTVSGTVTADAPVQLRRAQLHEGRIRSGDHVQIAIEGTVPAKLTRHIEPVALILRSAQSGQMLFCSGTLACGVELAPGDFRLEVTLQMNVPPGIYLIEVVGGDKSSEQVLVSVPSLSIQVEESTAFYGTVNCNPSMRLRSIEQRDRHSA